MSFKERKSLLTNKGKGDEGMATMLKDVTENFKIMLNEKFDEQNKHFSDMLSKIVTLEENVVDVNNHVRFVEEKVTEIGNTQSNMGNDIDWMYNKVQTSEKLQRSKTVVITGIEYTQEENLIEIVNNIADILKVNLIESDFDEIYRIKSTDKKPRIIVKFTRTLVKQRLINGIKVKKSLYAKELGIDKDKETQIYLNEYLSQKSHELWKEVKKLRSSNKVKYAWIRDGEVYIRKEEGGERVHVNNFYILNKFKEHLNSQKNGEN